MSDVALGGQTAVLEVVVDPTRAKSGAAEVESALQSMSGSGAKFLGMLNSAFQGMISFIEKATSSLATFLGIAGGAYAIKSMIDRMIDVNLVYNSFIATMTMVRGSLSAAQAEFQYITDYANRMGASVEESAKVYIRLAAALKEVDKSGQAARQVFESVAQAQAVLHLKGYETNGIFLAMEQIVSKGKVSLEEVQKQLGNRIPDAMGIASRAMGVTQKEFRESITKGTIDPLEFVLKLANQIKIEYGSAAKEAAEMFNGQMMRMKNAVFNLYLAVGQSGAMDGLMHIIQAITAMLQDPNVGKAFGQSLNELFSGIASWISKITASDVADFFDSLGAIVTTLIDLLKNLGKAFSTTSTSGKTDMLDFADGVSTVLITITDMVLTLVAAITSVPLALNAMAQDVKFLDKKLEVFRGPDYAAEMAQISADRDKAIKLSEGNDAILFMTDESPTVKAMKKKDEIFKTLRANRENASTQPSFSDAGYDAKRGIGRPLTDQEIADLTANGPGAPGSKKKTTKDVFNTESTALVKAASVANLEYNNLMNNQNKIENQNLITLNAKIATDKNYAILSADKIAKLRELAVVADKAILQEKAAEEFSKTRLELNKAMYTSEQALLDVTQYRDGLAEKNQRTLQEKFTFDAIYIAMSKDMKDSLMAQAVALDAVAIATRKANNIEQSRYQTMILTLQTQRDLDNFDQGLGASKYTELAKIQDSFLKGGANQFADIEEQSKLMADAVTRDIQNMTREMGNFKFSQDEIIRGYDFEASMIGKTSIEIQKATAEKKIYDQFRLNGIDLTKQENAAFKLQAQIMATDMANALQLVADRQNDWLNGAKTGLATYVDGTKKAADDVASIMTKSFKSLEDALVNFVTTGKLSFKDLANSIIADIARIVIKAQITGPLANMVLGFLGGSGGGGGGASGGGAGGIGGAIGMAQQGYSMYNTAAGIGSAIFGSGSGTVASWLAGTSSVAPTSVLAANATGALGGDALGTLISAEGWSAGGAAAGSGLGAAAGGAAAAEGGAAAGAAALEGGTAAGGSSVLAAIPVYGWIALAALAIAHFGQGKDRELTGVGLSGTLGTDNLTRDVSWTKDGGWFNSDTAGTWKYGLKDSSTVVDGRAYSDPASADSDKALLKGLTKAYDDLKTSAGDYAKSLGLDASYLKDRTQEISTNLGTTQEEITKNINTLMANVANDISKELLNLKDKNGDSLSSLAKEGEKASDTLTRLATDTKTVNETMANLGLKLYEVNVSGIKASENLISQFGTLQNFKDVTSSFFSNYYSDTEKAKLATDSVAKAFKDAGYEMPNTRDALRSMIEAAKALGTEAGDKTYASLMKLSVAFAAVTPAAEKAADTVVQTVKNGKSSIQSYNLKGMGPGEIFEKYGAEALISGFNNDTIFQGINAWVSGEERIAKIRAQTAKEDAIIATANATAQAMQDLRDKAQATIPALLAAGKVQEAMSANLVGAFNAKTFSNQAVVEYNAKSASSMMNTVSANALGTQNVGQVMGELWGRVISEDFVFTVGQKLKSGFGQQISQKLGDAISNVVSVAADIVIRRDYAPTGPGIASVRTANAQLDFDSYKQTVNGTNVYGKDVIAYRDGLTNLDRLFAKGLLSLSDYKEGLQFLDYALADAKKMAYDTAAQLNRIREDGEKLTNSGFASIGFYFNEITKSVTAMNAAAATANTTLNQTTSAIGRLNSLSTVMSESVTAVKTGIQAQMDAISQQMTLTKDPEQQSALSFQLRNLQSQMNMTGLNTNDVGKADLIGKAAAIASQIMTTADAKGVANTLTGNTAFKDTSSTQIRNISLMFDGLKQFDPASFEAAFTRINGALIDGSVNADQYAVLFNTAIDIFNNGVKSATSELEKAQEVLNTMKTNAQNALNVLSISINAQKALYKTEYDLKIKGINDQKAAAQTEYNDKIKALSLQISATQDSIKSIGDIVNLLDGALSNMRMKENLAGDRRFAQSYLTNARDFAQQTGQLPDSKQLREQLGVIAQPSEELFSSFEEYARDFYVTAGVIKDLNDVAGPQLSTAQMTLNTLQAQMEQEKLNFANLMSQLDAEAAKALDVYNRQLEGLDKIYENAKLQLDMAMGTYVATVSVQVAVNSLTDSIAKLTAAQQAANAINAQQVAIQIAASGLNIPGFASGGDFGGGWRLVGENGPEIEATGSSRIFNAEDTQKIFSGGNDQSETAKSIDAMNKRMDAQEFYLKSIANNMKKTADNTKDSAEVLQAAQGGQPLSIVVETE